MLSYDMTDVRRGSINIQSIHTCIYSAPVNSLAGDIMYAATSGPADRVAVPTDATHGASASMYTASPPVMTSRHVGAPPILVLATFREIDI